MSLYNMMFGMNARLAVLVSPFLPRNTKEFPRFRDVFLAEEDATIHIFCRMGGGNRDCWNSGEDNCDCCACDANNLERDQSCIDRFDDEYDQTYCTFVWKISEEWQKDFSLLKTQEFEKLSDKYFATLKKQYSEEEKILEWINSFENNVLINKTIKNGETK